ncbi:MAG TPA: PQQ-dependent sugar dehydrogenase [Hyphomicrobiales bacterium]|nr:PQQ-dependent sugar dehydrogenase [Hyphomicrobiales bacterium]
MGGPRILFAIAVAAFAAGGALAQTNGSRTGVPARDEPRVETVARGLVHPWSLAFLPDGRMLVTERPGRLRIVDRDGRLSAPLAGVPAVHTGGQAGLFDVVLDPNFASDRTLYLSYMEPRRGGSGVAVARAVLRQDDRGLDDVRVIFRAEPTVRGDANLGSRLAFGRDGMLFVTVGDRFTYRDQAQNLANDLGKIIRIAPDGSVPRDNPFVGRAGARPEIWDYGHRNPEAAAIDPASGVLWTVEHGPRGGDEVNIERPSRNYGWPVITYGIDYNGEKIGIGTHKAGMEQPIHYWDPSIAPSGMAFYTGSLFPAWRGSLFVGALKAEMLVRLTLAGDRVTGEEHLLRRSVGQRIRDVRQGPDSALYLLTDEAAGRVLKLVPAR